MFHSHVVSVHVNFQARSRAFEHDQQACDDYRKRHVQIGDLGSVDIRGGLFLFWTSPGDRSLVERGTNSADAQDESSFEACGTSSPRRRLQLQLEGVRDSVQRLRRNEREREP